MVSLHGESPERVSREVPLEDLLGGSLQRVSLEGLLGGSSWRVSWRGLLGRCHERVT